LVRRRVLGREVKPRVAVRYEDYRNRSLRSLSRREFAFVMKALLYDAKPEEG
jgi:hypothetical protein